VVGDKFGATENDNQGSASNTIPDLPQTMATPMHSLGGATPTIHGFGGATPSHDSGISDEVWRPGGAVDQETVKDDGWGTSPGSKPSEYNDMGNGAQKDDGWGAPASNSWGAPPAQKQEDAFAAKSDDRGSSYTR